MIVDIGYNYELYTIAIRIEEYDTRITHFNSLVKHQHVSYIDAYFHLVCLWYILKKVKNSS